MQISRLFGACPVDTEQWHCQEHFEAYINSSLVNKADSGAVPQFPFPENPEPVYT